jgi:type II secretion system protein G
MTSFPPAEHPTSVKHRGFTLVEVIVVVLILSILLSIAIPLYLSSAKNSSIQTVKANLKIIARAAQAYKVKNGTYPASVDALINGGDLEPRPSGPRGVTYELTGDATTCIVSATETGIDAFYDNGANTEGTYDLQSGQFANIEQP